MPRKESNIRKRKDGRWEARYISGKTINGKSIYSSVYGKTYLEVKKKRLEKISNLNLNINNIVQIKFHTVCFNWLDSCQNKVKESTFTKYQYICNHYIIEYFDEMFIQDISTTLVQKYFNSLQKPENKKNGLSISTVKIIYSILKLIFKYANQNGISTNCNLDTIQIKTDYVEPRYLSVEEQVVLENSIKNSQSNSSVGIWLGLFTGMRLGEICALKWNDVYLDKQLIYVNKTMQRISCNEVDNNNKTKIIIDAPKSKKSLRYVPVPKFCIDIMVKYLPDDLDTYVLTGTKDYIEPRRLEYYFTKIVRECKLEKVHFHTLRHTFTTRCIESGFDIKTLSEILGHSTTSFTLNRYGHSSINLKIENIQKLKQLS